ncbi:T6SS immunity protein Tdi1 domain-containing protein [Pseudactinotalea suaedae]|uniref:T6SS immunity protein Tdi1 domain-containing protein n=1 Tax=Pseudactinotalea suaedae TaxID=1524924 RepID=UPI0012E1F6CF|nr:T6SS immunity protein Tdi1 domain-containing protein [Pseudactinotalea suaedae]
MTTPAPADLPGWHPYTFAEEPAPTAEMMPTWPRLHGPYPLLHGFSRFGHVFLSDEDQQQFCAVYPLEGGSKAYPAASLTEFRRTVTDDPGFQSWIFPPSLVRSVVERLGPIGPEEVYMPVPYPMLGGSGAPETYSKGDVWVFLEIVGELWQRA